MKKYNTFNKQLLALWILIPILMFFLICNATYAYLTATTDSPNGSATTAKVQIKFTDNSVTSVSTDSTTSTSILPGDTLTMKAKVYNESNVQIYLLLKFEVSVKKSSETSATVVATKYYSLRDSTLTEITQKAGANTTDTSDDDFSSYVQSQAKESSSNLFSATFKFDGDEYDNGYINATASCTLKAYAIQYDHVSDKTATQLLWEMANS